MVGVGVSEEDVEGEGVLVDLSDAGSDVGEAEAPHLLVRLALDVEQHLRLEVKLQLAVLNRVNNVQKYSRTRSNNAY